MHKLWEISLIAPTADEVIVNGGHLEIEASARAKRTAPAYVDPERFDAVEIPFMINTFSCRMCPVVEGFPEVWIGLKAHLGLWNFHPFSSLLRRILFLIVPFRFFSHPSIRCTSRPNAFNFQYGEMKFLSLSAFFIRLPFFFFCFLQN